MGYENSLKRAALVRNYKYRLIIMRNISLNIRTTDQTEKACKLIEQQNHFCLKVDQWNKVCQILDKEGSENEKLSSLFDRKDIFKEQ